jgi:hypothetical protein
VSAKVLEGVNPSMNEQKRKDLIAKHISKIKKDASEDNKYDAAVRAFYAGNEYYLMVYQVFKDIRLVGAPPSNIGKFGGDTDNWMWPRHTGDFSIFRIYANKDNNPAEYSKDNVPYKPKKFLPISLKGVEKGDFTFVFGFPGTTQEYLPSDAIQMITEVINPVRIDLRQTRLDIFGKYMQQSDQIRIQYAAKDAGIANGWKKWIGENRGIKRLSAITKKKDFEADMNHWIDNQNDSPYKGLTKAFTDNYKPLAYWKKSETWLVEAAYGIEALRFVRSFNSLVELNNKKDTDPAKIEELVKRLISGSKEFFKDYNSTIDQEVMIALLEKYQNASADISYPDILTQISQKYDNNWEKFAEKVFKKSILINEEKLLSVLENYKTSDAKKISRDPLFKLTEEILSHHRTIILPKTRFYEQNIDSLQRVFVRAQMEFTPTKRFYPDANSTLRVAYGKVNDYYPRDGVKYTHFTTLDGIMEKESAEVLDYVVEPRLKELYKSKDYGRYAASDGRIHTAFTATNHTTGGNSGSPVLNADGELIGINFDRNWEGTMSDLMYDPEMCRNISLDIRYCLFIIDKLAGAHHLIEEMCIMD